MGDCLVVVVGLMGSEDHASVEWDVKPGSIQSNPRIMQILLFRNPKGRRLLRVPQFGPPAMGVLKSLGTPFRACVRKAFWWYHYLRAFSGVDIGAPGIKNDCCIYGIRAIYGFFRRLRATPVVVGPLATVPPGDRFLSLVPDGRGSYERGSRGTLVYWLELMQLKCIINLGTWTQQCPR